MYTQVFTPEYLDEIFPLEKSDAFFEALYGDASEGAYDIKLRFEGGTSANLQFLLHLEQRPGKCLACNLTYGLPEVFSRHPLLAMGRLADELAEKIDRTVDSWKFSPTRELSSSLHAVPFTITLS
jgi:hypothetical protein